MIKTILYLAHLKDNKHRENDEDILFALKKLGYKVLIEDDREFNMKSILKKAEQADLFLFHKGGMNEDTEETSRLSLERLTVLLQTIRKQNPACKIAFWYVDKIYRGREIMVEAILPLVDFGFTVDGTYVRRHNHTNLIDLKQATADKFPKGHKNPIYECDIAYVGSVYAEPRKQFVSAMGQQYGEHFRVYTDVYGQDFADLCASAKIIISPDYPLNDFYWGDRIYRVLGCGGFLVHPRLHGLTLDGIVNNAHYVGYYDWEELKNACDSFMLKKNDKIRKKIAKQGHDLIMKDHTYTKRLQTLLDYLK